MPCTRLAPCGGLLVLDQEHAREVARRGWEVPLMWRCLAGHTFLDGSPSSARQHTLRPMDLATRRLRAAHRFFKPKRCRFCGEMYTPSGSRQYKCARCPKRW